MSGSAKKPTPGKQSSLLSFFGKPNTDGGASTTPTRPKPTHNQYKTPKSEQSAGKKIPKPKAPVEDDDDEDMPVVKNKSAEKQRSSEMGAGSSVKPSKRRRAVIDDDDSPDQSESDAEFKMEGSDDTASEENVSSGEEEESVDAIKAKVADKLKKKLAKSNAGRSSPITTTPKSAAKRSKLAAPSTPSAASSSKAISNTSLSFLGSFRADQDTPSKSTGTPSKLDATAIGGTVSSAQSIQRYKHFAFEFLKPENIRDANKRRPTDDQYEAGTLYVPADFIKQQTPGHRQWWNMKTKHYDTLLFFKVGKFYELYHMDAVTAVQELNLMYMKGDYAHCGFPEIAYERFANQLVARGHKVARVEQTETPAMLEERMKADRSGGAREKVVRREVCRVTSAGTKTFNGPLITDSQVLADHDIAAARYLLAVYEQLDVNETSTYGVCFVDTTVGHFWVGQFTDDGARSGLRTLLAHFAPAELLTCRNNISVHTNNILTGSVSSTTPRHALVKNKHFWTAKQTLQELHSARYSANGFGEFDEWPTALKCMLDESDGTHQTAAAAYDMAVSCLGAVLWYLRQSLIDVDMLSMRRVSEYAPTGQAQHKNTQPDQQHMLLDGVSIKNLCIVPPIRSAGQAVITADGSLFRALDRCVTIFGKRELRSWLCAPLYQVDAIVRRQNAVQCLRSLDQKHVKHITTQLKQLPDLERLLQRLHSFGLKYRASEHPDSRAIMFDGDKYNKRKVLDLLAALKAFETVASTMDYVCQATNIEIKQMPELLRELCCHAKMLTQAGKLPYIQKHLKHFKKAFDHEKARADGVIIPARGVDESYDQVCDRLNQCEKAFDDYLKEQRKFHSCSNINYFGTGKNRYQLEVPDAVASRLPSSYEFKSQRKGFKRYSTRSIDDMFARLMLAEEARDVDLKDILRRVFADFDSHYDDWLSSVLCCAQLDVLMSFAKYADSAGCAVVMPELVPINDNTQPLIELVDGVHPCLVGRMTSGEYIPNDVQLGAFGSNHQPCVSLLLLTGPNMGGKSSLMRTVSLISVMAQIVGCWHGCYVTASRCRMTPVDRIFTRIGASDRMLAGQSTFYVELNETQLMLNAATRHSLLIVDELGRGTATHDGTAIAYATLKHLAQETGARTLFATHYHTLVDDVAGYDSVKSMHMACMVENENTDDPTDEAVTFLFKLTDGPCPKSYGFFAAKLAGLPLQVVRNAHSYSRATFSALTDDTKNKLKQLCHEHNDDQALAQAVIAC